MPLANNSANNSTGAGAGDNYNSSNPAMVTGILSPADGNVYVYGYDDNRQQVTIRKIAKSAQVPHKGMTPHPVYTNNLLSTYKKVGVVPVAGTQQARFSWGDSNRFKQVLQNMSGELRRGALHGVAGTQQPMLTWSDSNRFKQALQNISGSPKSGALHGVAGTQQPMLTWSDSKKFKQKLENMSGTPKSGALHGVAGSQQPKFSWGDDSKKFKQKLQNMSGNLRRGALHGVAGSQQPRFSWGDSNRFKQKLQNISGNLRRGALHGVTSKMLASYGWSQEQKNNFRQQLKNMSITPPSGALHGKAGAFSFKTTEGKNRTNHTQQWLDLRRQSGFKSMGALHGRAGTNTRGSATTKNSQGQTISFTNLLSPTVRRLDALAQNPVTGSHTHALYGRAGSGGSLVQGKFTTYKTQAKDVMGKGGALHGRPGLGGAGNSAFGAVMGALQSVLGAGGSNWPIARFHFYVMIGGTELGFQAVEGLEAAVGVIEYRDGNSPFFGKEKMPGLITYEKVTMKKGMFTNDTSANGWFKEIAQDRQYTKRRTIIIALMDNNLVPQFVWRYEQCFLTKVVPTNLDAESENEVAIEELEFVGRAWYLETLAGMAGNAVGALAGAAGINLSF